MAMNFPQTNFGAALRRAICVTALGAIAICGAIAVRAQSSGPPKVDVALVAEQIDVRPAQWLWVGLQFKLPSGWHIYWSNPGDSGEPPKIQWNLPQGFHAGDFQWPYPERIEAPSIVDYGYANGVVLLTRITVPVDLPVRGTVTLAGEVRYLVCREICVPAKASVQLTLPVEPRGGPEDVLNGSDVTLFEQTMQRVPKPAPAAWQARVKTVGDEFILTLRTPKPASQVEFFPLDTDVIENSAAQNVRSTVTGIEIHLKKSDQLLKPIAQLRGVVVFPGQGAYSVTAPVTQPPAVAGASH